MRHMRNSKCDVIEDCDYKCSSRLLMLKRLLYNTLYARLIFEIERARKHLLVHINEKNCPYFVEFKRCDDGRLLNICRDSKKRRKNPFVSPLAWKDCVVKIEIYDFEKNNPYLTHCVYCRARVYLLQTPSHIVIVAYQIYVFKITYTCVLKLWIGRVCLDKCALNSNQRGKQNKTKKKKRTKTNTRGIHWHSWFENSLVYVHIFLSTHVYYTLKW